MKFFPSRPDEDKNELFFFTSEGKIKPRIRILALENDFAARLVRNGSVQP